MDATLKHPGGVLLTSQIIQYQQHHNNHHTHSGSCNHNKDNQKPITNKKQQPQQRQQQQQVKQKSPQPSQKSKQQNQQVKQKQKSQQKSKQQQSQQQQEEGTGVKKVGPFFEAPIFLRVPFIINGYRIGYKFIDCLISLFQIHNETGNIWSHLLGSLFWVYCMIYTVFNIPQPTYALVICIYLLGCFSSLSASTVFHWFNCVNVQCHTCLRSFDFSGIALNVQGVAWSTLYFSFYCNSFFFYLYSTIFAAVTPFLLAINFMTFFHTRPILRTTLYVVSTGVPFYCFIHYLITEGLSAPIHRMLYVYSFVTYTFFGIGLAFYLSRYPERLYPGKFDYIFSSHQLWHVFVILGQYSFFRGLLTTSAWRLEEGCPVN